DLLSTLGPAPAKGFASHGENWSLPLALRLAPYNVLCQDDPNPAAQPLLLLDDGLAALDAARRTRLVEMTRDAEQVIITAAVTADIPEELSGTHIPIQMSDGLSTSGEHHDSLEALRILEANYFADAEGSQPIDT